MVNQSAGTVAQLPSLACGFVLEKKGMTTRGFDT